jgi:integrase-like protein
MVVMDVFTRRIIGFGVERADLCGASICRMFNQIIAGKSLPQHLSSDHDPLFRFHRWVANLRILEIEEIKSIPYVPVSIFVERLIGTIRRECLDHVLIWNAVDLERKLEEFRTYHNDHRVHQSLCWRIRETDLANRRPPTPSLSTTPGGAIAAVCSKCRSRRNLRIRHALAGRLPAPLRFCEDLRIRHAQGIEHAQPERRVGVAVQRLLFSLFCAGGGAALSTHDALNHHGRDAREHGLSHRG